MAGFGARRQRNAVTYFLKYRTAEGRQRWYTIGRHGAPWIPDSAQEEARRLLGDVVQGRDPAADKRASRCAATVGELCDHYFADAKAGRVLVRGGRSKTVRTLSGNESMVRAHIKPLLGRLPVMAVTRSDIEEFLHAVAEGKTGVQIKTPKKRGLSTIRGGVDAASRTVGLLGAIFAYGARKGLRLDNPVRGVQRPADGQRERRLTDREYAALGMALRQASARGVWPPAVAVARFIAVSCWRRGEVLGLHWSEVDLPRRTATLNGTKTGRSMRPLSCGM